MSTKNLNGNKDIIPLNSRKKTKDDKADIMPTGCSGEGPSMTKGNDDSDTMFLDTPVKPEYDTERALKSEYDKRRSKTKDDNIVSSSLSFPCLTRESRSHECRIESGRSMVEMLGVLAVIGVLSIGGIMGYSYGMDKYRANETINDINLRKIDLMAQTENGNNNPTLDAWNDEKTLYPITLVFDADSGAPLIQVSNVPEQVCEMIVENMEKQAAITVNSYYTAGQEDGGCEEKNDLTFYFGDYTVCGTDYCSGNTPICHPDSQTCVACLNSGDCPSETPICNDNMCEVCPVSKPFYDASTGICGDCQSDDDCSGEAICLNNNNVYVNYTNGPSLGGKNKCTSLALNYTTVLTSEESPDGKEWGKVRTSDFLISHRDADRICSKFGKILPSLSDFGVNCNPPNHCDKTETAKKLAKLHTWASERNGENGLLINLSISDTRLHPYWFTDRGVAQEFFCRDK